MDVALDIFRAEPGRLWNCMLGGKDNFEADRQVARAVLSHSPGFADLATVNERFKTAACLLLAKELKVDQFVDCAAGLPITPLHEIVQAVRPEARVLCGRSANSPGLRSDNSRGGGSWV